MHGNMNVKLIPVYWLRSINKLIVLFAISMNVILHVLERYLIIRNFVVCSALYRVFVCVQVQ